MPLDADSSTNTLRSGSGEVVTLNAGPFSPDGGDLDPDAATYISRAADSVLLDSCLRGEYCNILTSRQVGKTSLINRTFRALRERELTTAALSLEGFQIVGADAESFFYSFADAVLGELDVPVKLSDWWDMQHRLDPLRRLSRLFSTVLLPTVGSQLVVFVDEIDAAVELPFSDDFFTWIRSCYTARGTNPVFRSLSFVLAGVVEPADLIKNQSRTPYNIGRRIALNDFSAEDLEPFARAFADLRFEDPQRLLREIVGWTGGHPYLTQKLCGELVREGGTAWSPERILRLVDRLFLSEGSHDLNLRFIDRMIEERSSLGGDADRGPDRREVLRVYGDVRRGFTVSDEEQSRATSPKTSVRWVLRTRG